MTVTRFNDFRMTESFCAPLRIVCKDTDPSEAATRGTLLFFHGFGASIEIQTKELYALANLGFLVVGVDAVGHGARRWPDFDQRFNQPAHARRQHMFEIIRASAQEVPMLVDQLIATSWARTERVGVGGISMGGYIAYRARVLDARLSVVFPLLASPRWPCFEDESPHRFGEQFSSVVLLSQNAAEDEAVDPSDAATFAKALIEEHGALPECITHIEHPKERHQMTEAGWAQLLKNLSRGLLRHWSHPSCAPPA